MKYIIGISLVGLLFAVGCGNTTEATPEVIEDGYRTEPIDRTTTTEPARTDGRPNCASTAEAVQGISGAWYCKKKGYTATTRSPLPATTRAPRRTTTTLTDFSAEVIGELVAWEAEYECGNYSLLTAYCYGGVIADGCYEIKEANLMNGRMRTCMRSAFIESGLPRSVVDDISMPIVDASWSWYWGY